MMVLLDRRPMNCTLFVKQDFGSSTTYWITKQGASLELAGRINDAAMSGRVAELEELLQKEECLQSLHFSYKIWNTSTLYCACSKGYLNAVQLLLDNNHDVNLGNRFGSAPVEVASMRNHGDVVFELLIRGATLTEEAVIAAAQWNCHFAISSMHIAGHFTDEFLLIADAISRERGHANTMQIIDKISELSALELAADQMNVRGILHLSKRKAKINPTYKEFSKALTLLSKSKLKSTKSQKEYRECRDGIRLGNRTCKELVHDCFSRIRVTKKKVLLATAVPKFNLRLAEFLNIIPSSPEE